MMVKRLLSAVAILVLLTSVLMPTKTQAETASVFVSPSSSSVTKGDKITVQVRVNSGTDPMNTAQARLNFDSSRLQYVSYSSGAFTTPVATNQTSSSFEYAGALLGSTVSGNQLIFSVTLKAVATGTASLSISNAQVANAGESFTLSTSGGSISITSDSSGGSSGGSDSTTSSPPTSSSPSGGQQTQTSPEPVEPPKFVGEPEFEQTQGTILVKLEADKPSSLRVGYATGDDEQEIVWERDEKTKHELLVGKDQPLQAGTKYKLQIRLTDTDGNHSDTKTASVRTKGVTFKVKILDQDDQPLVDHPVELHSEPLQATTDDAGYATFEDVTPGKHTLVFEIDGITMRQPVKVGQPLVAAGENEDETGSTATVRLPFGLAQTEQATPTIRWDIVGLAGITGAGLMFVLQTRAARHFLWTGVKRFKSFTLSGLQHIHKRA
ncbi:MAG: cohesin domain-containing protein [Candidatus Saccharibacteria bacterium]|nr:cohesin domain-containing protein [Candidatus Saccharibacteria bacterium]